MEVHFDLTKKPVFPKLCFYLPLVAAKNQLLID